jgi:single-strand DNA-binding protein
MSNQFAVPFNQEAAIKAGGSDFLQDGGAHTVTIISAEYIIAKTGSQGMEFEIKTDSGQSAKFITIYYKKADGAVINSGYSTLCGIMFFLGLQGLSMQNAGADSFAPELAGQKVGLFLQKVLYTKNAGGEGYKFDIRAPYKFDTLHTVREAQENKQPTAIQNWINSYQDKDERTAQQPQSPSNSFDSQPTNDDIPW